MHVLYSAIFPDEHVHSIYGGIVHEDIFVQRIRGRGYIAGIITIETVFLGSPNHG
jgi:hypothetical protein